MGTYIHTYMQMVPDKTVVTDSHADGPGQVNADRQTYRWSRTRHGDRQTYRWFRTRQWGQTDIQMVPDKTMGTDRHTDGPANIYLIAGAYKV